MEAGHGGRSKPLTYLELERLAVAANDADGMSALNRFYDWRRGSAAGVAKGLAAVAITVFTGYLAEVVKARANDAVPPPSTTVALVLGVAAGFAAAALVANGLLQTLERKYLTDIEIFAVLQRAFAPWR